MSVTTEPTIAVDRRDVRTALLLASSAFVVYLLTRQDWWFDDGTQLINMFAQHLEGGAIAVWMHVLYLPLAHLVHALVPGYAPVFALQLVSAAPAALAVGSVFLILRQFGASRRESLLAAGLLAGTPAHWFFATTVEVHALHEGCVAVFMCATVLAPWRHRPRLATAISATGLAFAYASHKSGLLLTPGWILLAQLSRSLQTRRSSWGRDMALVTAAHIAALVVAILVTALATGSLGSGLGVGSTLEFVQRMYQGFSARILPGGLLWPLALVLPLSVYGMRGRSRLAVTMVGTLFVPVLLFFLFVFGQPTRGGYFLGVLPMLCVASAGAFRELDRVSPRIAVGAVGLQALFGAWFLFGADEGLAAVRLECARLAGLVLPEGGVLVTFDPSLQTMSGMREGLLEENLSHAIKMAHASRMGPQQLSGLLSEFLGKRDCPIAVDLRYRREPGLQSMRRYADSIVEYVREHGPGRIREVDGAEFLVVDR